MYHEFCESIAMLIGKVVEKSTKDLKTEVGIDDPDGFYFGDVHSD